MNLICPNCRTIAPPWNFCIYCNAPFNELLKNYPSTFTSMDPRLHYYAERARYGIPRPATASTKEAEESIIARVKDVSAFRSLAQARIIAVINPFEGGDKTTIVTARIPKS